MRPNNQKGSPRIGAVLLPPFAGVVRRLKARGFTETEIVRRGIRLVAAEENIAIEEIACE